MLVDKLKQTVAGIIMASLFLAFGTAYAETALGQADVIMEQQIDPRALNLTQGVTETSQRVYDLHMQILYIVTIIGIIVFGVMGWSIFHHRKSKGAVAAQFHHNTTAEVIWTAIPIIILIVMAVPATKTLIFMEQTSDTEMTLKVTGYQWKWRYDYLDDGVEDGLEDNVGFFSVLKEDSNRARQKDSGIDPNTIPNYLLDVDNPVVLPINTKIRILTTAADVIHAWWVPDLGWKRDAIPGYITDNWTNIKKPGIYRGQCAELCGRGHAFMPIVVKAVVREEYDVWIKQQKEAQADAASGANREWTKAELLEKGKAIYATTCANCHMPEGQGLGVFPALAGSAIVNGAAADMIHLVLNGKNLMPAFKDQLNDVDIAAVITHERNSWNNTAADVVQPKDVKAARQQ